MKTLCVALLAACSLTLAAAATHPLDPLSADEIQQTALILRRSSLPASSVFPILVLQEPPKDEVLANSTGPLRREAYVEILDAPTNRVWQAVVDLTHGHIASLTLVPNVQPAVLNSDYAVLQALVRADPKWRAAMLKRGILDVNAVYIDGWAGADETIPGLPAGTRIMRALSFLRDGKPNPYDRPIEGVVVSVDMNRRKVVEVTDTVVAPVSGDPGNAVPPSSLKPLSVVQAHGPSFQITGNEVRWQNWRFRYALHPREGLVLYTVGWQDDGRVRPILYRASMSEAFIPYGLPDVNWKWRHAFDVGEYGLGRTASGMTAGLEVPDNATLLDATLSDQADGSYVTPGAVAIYEQHDGLLWNRVDPDSLVPESGSARQLVVVSTAAIGNYTYALKWIFRLNGEIECRVELTGTLLLRGVLTAAQGNQHGTLVARHVSAPIHQHFFNFRLDFDVDGPSNSVVEENLAAAPQLDFISPPAESNSIELSETLLENTVEAQRDLNLPSNRGWKVINPGSLNPLGEPVAYSLVPGGNTVPYIGASNPGRLQAGFINHHFWATPYDAKQLYAAGQFPFEGKPNQGLPTWAASNASIVNRDVVVWYTMGFTHHPEVEEYPVMSAEHIGFKIKPNGFFSGNPAIQ